VIPKFTSHPIRLHVVRAGQHIDPLPDFGSLHRLPGRGFGFACFVRLLLQCPNQLPVRIDHFHPELLSAPFKPVIVSVELEYHVVEIAPNSFGCCQLRHGSMETSMPRGILIGMASAAIGRADVLVLFGMRNLFPQLSIGRFGPLQVSLPGRAHCDEQESGPAENGEKRNAAPLSTCKQQRRNEQRR